MKIFPRPKEEKSLSQNHCLRIREEGLRRGRDSPYNFPHKEAREMTLTIRTKNLELTPSLKEYTEKRFAKLDRFSRNIIHTELLLEEQRGIYMGEFIVKVKGKTLKAKSSSKDPMALVDELRDIMANNLKAYEEKLRH